MGSKLSDLDIKWIMKVAHQEGNARAALIIAKGQGAVLQRLEALRDSEAAGTDNDAANGFEADALEREVGSWGLGRR